ncbi:hypothetical protein EKO04_006209 [Ascochyta lentis]|uniref:Protein transport protein SFT2 n=1 Tax=Ascochyta lentis TaxID=205686 RepID=A0A8H7J580_9PLEO|nr:hypothetical protein EKO04_006209 [Ascochyta lentis]
MASASFRDSMNSLGWSRREPDAPVNTAPPSVMDRVSNLFGAGGYVRLPISESNPGAPLPAPTRREEEEGFFARKYTLAQAPPIPLYAVSVLRQTLLRHFLLPCPLSSQSAPTLLLLYPANATTTRGGPGDGLSRPIVSRWDRLLVFGGLLLAALAMFATCIGLMFTPIFIVKPRKFAILWTMGSVLFLAAWSVMMGPLQYGKQALSRFWLHASPLVPAADDALVQHLISGPRLPFTAAYFGSIALTLYFSLGRPRDQLHSTILTFIAVIAQLVSLLWFTVSYFPMGSTGLRFGARFAGNRVAAWMND